MKRVRGTKFPQSRPESISAIRWWNRGNAFKVSAAFLPVLERPNLTAALNPSDAKDVSIREVFDYLVAQGDAQLQLKSSRSRRGFFVAQSVINLISLELDRIEEIFPQVEAAVEFWLQDSNPTLIPFLNTNPARQYVDAFFGPRDIPPLILHYLWSRIVLDWFAARLPFAFFQGTLELPEVPEPRREVLDLFPSGETRRTTPTPPQLVQTHADLQAALAARAYNRQSV